MIDDDDKQLPFEVMTAEACKEGEEYFELDESTFRWMLNGE